MPGEFSDDQMRHVQGRAIESLHRQLERLELQQVRLIIALGKAFQSLLDAKADLSDLSVVDIFACTCEP